MPESIPNNEPHKSNVLHALEHLEQEGLIRKVRGRWYCTKKGEEAAKSGDVTDDEIPV